ncbi:MAG TPA: hypothetical protein VFY05_05545, partial [Candidatus Angelobacter sp.]|nr:hypothetical protein [Candidatus Angelobacter sp.]
YYIANSFRAARSSGSYPGPGSPALPAFTARCYIRVFKINLRVTTNNQGEAIFFKRLAGLLCIALVLWLAGLEALHAHHEVANVRSTPCAICLSVHANAPAITLLALPTLSELEILVAPSLIESYGIQTEISLFTRPPPVL